MALCLSRGVLFLSLTGCLSLTAGCLSLSLYDLLSDTLSLVVSLTRCLSYSLSHSLSLPLSHSPILLLTHASYNASNGSLLYSTLPLSHSLSLSSCPHRFIHSHPRWFSLVVSPTRTLCLSSLLVVSLTLVICLSRSLFCSPSLTRDGSLSHSSSPCLAYWLSLTRCLYLSHSLSLSLLRSGSDSFCSLSLFVPHLLSLLLVVSLTRCLSHHSLSYYLPHAS